MTPGRGSTSVMSRSNPTTSGGRGGTVVVIAVSLRGGRGNAGLWTAPASRPPTPLPFAPTVDRGGRHGRDPRHTRAAASHVRPGEQRSVEHRERAEWSGQLAGAAGQRLGRAREPTV